MFPFNRLSTANSVFGFCQAATGYAAWVFYQQEQFVQTATQYNHIGTNKQELVVYFSRLGYTRNAAYKEANRLGADIMSLPPLIQQQVQAVLGGAVFAMRGKAMPIAALEDNLSQYAHITLCTPIWVFRICSPMQTFCKEANGQIQSVSYILLHHNRARYAGAVRELDRLLDAKHLSAQSICCRMRKVTKRWVGID